MGSRQVAVDFGAKSLRAIEFSTNKKGDLNLHGAHEVPLLTGTIHRGKVADPESLITALQTLKSEAKFKAKDVAFAVSNNGVIVRRVDVDWQPEKYFRQALPYSIPDNILADGIDYQVDYHPLSESMATAADGSPRRRSQVLMVAAETPMIQGFLDALKGAGFRPAKADHTGFAITRLAAQSGRGGAELVIDLGAQTMNMVLHVDGQPLFLRHLGKGLEGIVEALTTQFGWTDKVALEAITALGASSQVALAQVATAFGGQPAAQPQETHPAQPVIDAYATDYINEIRTSVDWFLQNSNAVDTLDRVVFSGGGALLPGLGQRLAAELNIPVGIANPFEGLDGSKNVDVSPENSARWNVAVGIATGVK